MTKPKAFASRAIPEKGLAMVRANCEADIWTDELPPPREVVLERIRRVDGILSFLTDQTYHLFNSNTLAQMKLDNIIAPHIASASKATRDKVAEMAANNLLAELRGEKLPHCVNPEVYD